jgi:ferritin
MAEQPKRQLATPAPQKPTIARPSTSAPAFKTKNPMITEECVKHLNYRIEQEEYSSRIYLAMAMWLDDNGYKGAAKEWRKYSTEENAHADFAREYLLNLGVQPNTPALQSPTQTFTGLPQIIEMSYEHEIEITRQCKELASHAMKMADHLLYELAIKYLHEQQEEMGKMQDLMDELEAFGTDKIAMRLMDNKLGG